MIENIPPQSANGKVFHAGTGIDADGNIRADGGRVLCAVGLGDQTIDAQSRAYELVEKISWESAYFRTDIGFKALKQVTIRASSLVKWFMSLVA